MENSSTTQKILNFDPSTTISADFGIFGIPAEEKTSQVILLPVPWEVTTSYGAGASHGPTLIREASVQIDLFDLELGNAYEMGYFLKESSKEIEKLNFENKPKAQEVIRLRTELSDDQNKINSLVSEVNLACDQMTEWVYNESKKIVAQKKVLGLIGGDHSTPLGAIKAVSEFFPKYSVLHIDAHADLRKSYQGFTQSHASIMYNVMNLYNAPQSLVQVGIRDFCQEEYDFIQQ
nr:arginase family protein [Pseudobdellovibrionaceae bacterium]